MGKDHSSEDYKRLKLMSYQIKATTYLQGSAKNEFLNDSIKRDKNQSELLRDIVNLHYEIIKELNLNSCPEFDDVIKKISKYKY